MRKYLINLIQEKGVSLDDQLDIDGHFGITYQMIKMGINQYKNNIGGCLFVDELKT